MNENDNTGKGDRLAPDAATGIGDKDGLSQLMQQFEANLRDYIDQLLADAGARQELREASLVAELKRQAEQQLRRKVETIDKAYRERFAERAHVLAIQQKRLAAMTLELDEQRGKLRAARAEFDERLSATNALHQEVSRMRETLRRHLEPTMPRAEPAEQDALPEPVVIPRSSAH